MILFRHAALLLMPCHYAIAAMRRYAAAALRWRLLLFHFLRQPQRAPYAADAVIAAIAAATPFYFILMLYFRHYFYDDALLIFLLRQACRHAPLRPP